MVFRRLMKTRIFQIQVVSSLAFSFWLGGTISLTPAEAWQTGTHTDSTPKFLPGHNVVHPVMVELQKIGKARSVVEDPTEIIITLAGKKVDPAYRDAAARGLVDNLKKRWRPQSFCHPFNGQNCI